MKLLTKQIETKLRANYEKNLAHRDANEGECLDFKPAVKLFNPTGAGTWILTEFDGEDSFFGLADLHMGSPELGYVSKSELESFRGLAGLGIERDKWFTADKTLKEYAAEAREKGRIAA